ncbi:hypothetical protein D8674_037610 [Pyrus ussuriensis x Pyrus communis]|uniref:RNase H type-1 domain-containing protein n=1 Tax=Pyrus ussuriensis x Pyrus communis TaxID=2448454 RepID=A0A5N5H6Z2_9ROSA|nr:hypothetical protein D8674_037610 [Pyrus ussuriensis x Pyrus communis]
MGGKLKERRNESYHSRPPGKFIAGASGRHRDVISPLHAEVLAARFVALVLVQSSHGGAGIIFERDSSLVLAALKQKHEDQSTFGPIIEDTKGLLQALGHCEFRHTNRDANHAAHRLARSGIGGTSDAV